MMQNALFRKAAHAAAGMLAALAIAAATPAVAAEQAAEKYVSRLGDQALSVITDKALAKPQKQAKLEKIFADNVDIAWVAKFVMGRYWRSATDAQKTRYVAEYKKFLLKHYTSRFSDYSSGSFTITGSKPGEGDGETTVSMQMQSGDKGAEPVLVDYRLRKDGSGYRIFDVIVEGVSMITTQRAEFASVLGQDGIDALIGKLSTMAAPDDTAKKS